MRALVVYESMFGSTGLVADAIAHGLEHRMDVTVAHAERAPTDIPRDVALLVAGGPTHALGLSRPTTRADAVRQAGPTATSVAMGLREWLAALAPAGHDRPLVATFDTRIRKPMPMGSAARAAERRLRHLGYRVGHAPTSFWVLGTAGPLADGELARARVLGRQLAMLAVSAPPVAA